MVPRARPHHAADVHRSSPHAANNTRPPSATTPTPPTLTTSVSPSATSQENRQRRAAPTFASTSPPLPVDTVDTDRQPRTVLSPREGPARDGAVDPANTSTIATTRNPRPTSHLSRPSRFLTPRRPIAAVNTTPALLVSPAVWVSRQRHAGRGRIRRKGNPKFRSSILGLCRCALSVCEVRRIL